MSLQRILSILIAVIALIGAVLWVLIVRADGSEGPIGAMLNVGKWLVIIGAVIALIFTLKNIFSDGQKIKKTLTSVIAFAVLAGIAYVMAKGVAIEEGENTITESASKMVGTGIYLFYLLAAIAILIMVFFGIRKTFK